MNENDYSKKDAPIDFSSALERTGGDRSFLMELINLYLDDFKQKFEELQKAITEGNFSSIQELGHSLKGASANLSMPYLQIASHTMELAGKEKNIEKAQKTLQLLEQEFKRLNDFL